MERVNAEWLRGRCGSRQGIFPEAYVRVVVPLPGEPEPEPESEPEPEQGEGALVLYDFSPQEASDLALKVRRTGVVSVRTGGRRKGLFAMVESLGWGGGPRYNQMAFVL